MEYGRISQSEYESFDATLPADAAGNNSIFTGKPGESKLWLGCPQWGRKEWVGQIYPKGTKDSKFQDEYMKCYNAIEFNATHYQIFDSKTIEKWASKANGIDFRFCPKIFKEISHSGRIENAGIITQQFLDSIAGFGKNLGPLFLQLPEKFNTLKKQNLYNYLSTLPVDLQFFLEVRHPDWFANNELFEVLRNIGIGSVITDTPGQRGVVHMQLTVPKAFVRFQAIGGHHTDISRIDAWVQRIKQWFDKGIKEVYFFIHVHNEQLSPELTKYAVDQFNKICGTRLPEVKMLYPTLF